MRFPRLTVFAVVLALGGGIQTVHGDPLGTEFTYQGQLKDGGLPANGYYDFVFRLHDADTAGAQVDGDFLVDSWPVNSGLFTVEVDFGASAFASDARWLEVSVRPSDSGGSYTTLSPRQPVTAAPVALYALNGPGSGGFWAASGDDIYSTNGGNVGIGTTIPAAMLDVQSTEGTHGIMSSVPWIPVWAHRASTSGTWPAVHGQCDSEDPDGSAVRGIMTSASSGTDSAGVRGINSGYGYGVYGNSGGTGVCGETDSDWAAGVRGTSNATGFGFGVYGVHYGSGWGAYGVSFDSTGVRGDTHADWYSAGVHGHNDGVFGYGVHGTTDGGGVGVYGEVPSGIGVMGDSTEGTGVWGTTDSVSANAIGVYGVVSSTTPGSSSAGVRGHNNGTGGSGIGVYGSQDGSGFGVYGYAPSGRGVYGLSAGGTGVYGHNSATTWDGQGVKGTHAGYGTGVYGESIGGVGVHAKSTSGFALYAETSGTTAAARFVGNVEIVSPSTEQILIEFGEGLDYAEGFDVSDESQITPGTVLVIDGENAGQLTMSNGPYDRKVAGIVAGANGLGSAVRLGAGQYDFDVALAGRVYCDVDASYGAIRPGDLLTTSPTPGHAMKVTDHEKAQGAILGKAMEPLKQGERGQILVLVTLQ